MDADQILWYYRCEFAANPDLYEQYEKTYFVPGWCEYVKGYWNTGVHWRLTSKGHDFLNSTFHAITLIHNIEIDKADYRAYLERPNVRNPWIKSGRRWHRHDRHRPSKYVRKTHHKKKELSEKGLAKREWRMKKRKSRGERRYGCHPYLKHINKRSHRAMERQLIASDRYEDLHDRTWKCSDPWDWD